MRTFSSLKKLLWCGSAVAAMALAGTAQAQTAQPTPTPTPSDVAAAPATNANAPTPPSENEQIVVTGSRVIRDGYQAPTPLTVVTREDIQNTAPTNNIADLVNQLPALAGSTRPSNSRLELSSGIGGVNTLNLRNLGTVRTLVLLDGRRSVGSTVQGLVDVNTIPQLLVDRVEIVTGGASAAYGSDAVAGVVNFVLNKKLQGIRVESDIGITDKGDGLNYSTSVAAGLSFAGGRGHLLLAGEFAHKDGIFEVDREWNHDRLRPHPGSGLDLDQHDPAIPHPPRGRRRQLDPGRADHRFRRRHRQPTSRHLFRPERLHQSVPIRRADLPVADRCVGAVADPGRGLAGQRLRPPHRTRSP